MARQTKPFIVGIRPSRKIRTGNRKPLIRGSLDLWMTNAPVRETEGAEEPAAITAGGRSGHILLT